MSEPRICIACRHASLAVDNGVDTLTCHHAIEGAPAPLTPHEQRNRPADETANVCGAQAIFWEPKQ